METVPSDGLMPLAPLAADGIVMLPPVSSPMHAAASLAIGATPDPWLDPPGT